MSKGKKPAVPFTHSSVAKRVVPGSNNRKARRQAKAASKKAKGK